MQLKKIKNHSPIPQSIVVEGMQVILEKNSEQFFPVEIADAFLAECASYVKEVNIAQLYQEDERAKLVYLANMTGDPDGSATVKVKQPTDKGRSWAYQPVDNPLLAPRTLAWQMKGPQQEYHGEVGLEGLNVFPTTYSIPPYSRRAFEPRVATWILSRDSRCEPHYRNQVLESRAVAWAPELAWDLDDIRLFLRLCDPGAVLGPTEAELLAACAEDMWEDKKLVKLYEAKELALQRVHFRISNPKYPLPKKRDFEAVKRRENDEPVKRGPGRPRKNPEQPAA